MKAQQRTLLESIEQNYNNPQYLPLPNSTGLYKSETGSSQQLFLEKLINIYVLRKKEYNKIDQEKVQKLMKESSGGFTDLLLGLRFMAYCMENKVQVSYDKFGMLKLLTNWMDVFERIKTEQKVNLCMSVLGSIHPENHTISSTEELIVYANYIAVDLQTILQRPAPSLPKGVNQSASEIQSDSKKSFTYDHLEVQDMLLFLNNLIPKTLFNVVISEPLISGRPMTTMNSMDEKQKDLLYSWKSVEYFAKEKTHYQHLTKLLIFTVLKFDLTQSQQKNIMLVGIKYFYLFNRNKHQEPFSIWTKIFEKITDAVRFALSGELILFFRVIKKLGHTKFIQFLREKYVFIDDLHKKMDTNGVIGYPKDSMNVYHSMPITQHVFVSPGTKSQRYIEVLEPYSLLYFYVGVKNLDINIRFYYLGGFTSSVEKKQLLLTREKCQIEFKGNIIAIEKGIYMFEFDNSYSWMKGKSLYYDTAVLTPLDLVKGDVQREKFLPVLFNKFQMNACPQNVLIDINNIISQSLILGQNNNYQSLQQEGRSSQVFIENEKKKLFITTHYDSLQKVYNLKTVADGKIYEYESDGPTFFSKKANEILETLQESTGSFYEWYLDGKYELKSVQMLNKWCENPIEFAIEMEKADQQKQAQVVNQLPDQANEEVSPIEAVKQPEQVVESLIEAVKQPEQNVDFLIEAVKQPEQVVESLIEAVKQTEQFVESPTDNKPSIKVEEKQQYPTLTEQENITMQIPNEETPNTQPKTHENQESLEQIHVQEEEPTQNQQNK